MTNPLTSVVKPDILDENKMNIHSFLRESYNQAKKKWDEGVTLFQGGVTFFKDEFSSLYDKTDQYIDRMMLPVNNFLKDVKQIDSELMHEISTEAELVCLDGKIITIDQALSQPMEENY